MELQNKIFDRVVKFYTTELSELGFSSYVGDGYTEFISPKVKMTILTDGDGINITLFSDFDTFAVVEFFIDSLGEFDVFLNSTPELADEVSVNITLLGRGSESVPHDFRPEETQILPHLVKLAKLHKDK